MKTRNHVFITPEMAASYLERNFESNRRLQPQLVKGYIRELQQGQFTCGPGGIAFDLQGRLRDGQHRLTAVKNSGIGAHFTVHEDCTEDELLNIDTGRLRTVADQLTITQKEKVNAQCKASTISALAGILTGANSRTGLTVYMQLAPVVGEEHLDTVTRSVLSSVNAALVYARPLNPKALDLVRERLITGDYVLEPGTLTSVGMSESFRLECQQSLKALVSLVGKPEFKRLSYRQNQVKAVLAGIRHFLWGRGVAHIQYQDPSTEGLDYVSAKRRQMGLWDLTKGLPSLKDVTS